MGSYKFFTQIKQGIVVHTLKLKMNFIYFQLDVCGETHLYRENGPRSGRWSQ